MSDKIKKICQAFGVNLYRWPSSSEDAERRAAQLTSVILEKEQALQAYDKFVQSEATMMTNTTGGGNSRFEEWRLFVLKEKSIYASLNLFEGDINLRTNVWFPELEEAAVRELLLKESKATGTSAMLVSDRGGFGSKTPPTYIRTNAWTAPFQELVNTYGIPKYKEANPACFYTVTFPFMFGVMYGDIGHGFMLFLAGMYLVKYGESLKYTLPDIYNARYFITMMGGWAVYAGFLYNDFFSLGVSLFPTRWSLDWEGGSPAMIYYKADYDILNETPDGPYPFGLDPTWHGASNELLYLNSLKMKMAVCIGVVQMILGLCLRFSNALYERSITDFVCECCPMMVFMICFFGYMDFMILYKWVTPMDTPPSIINSLICMAMGQQDTAPLWGDATNGSVPLSQMLMKFTVLAVPIMLFPKPIILYLQNKNKVKASGHEVMADEEANDSSGGHGHGEFKLDEIIIHQVIEVIEYVLGTVSHTASYLRLWALSLAHQQLSLVFFQKTLLMGFTMDFPGNGIALFFLFACWFGITCGVLLGMDVLECFLHDLRLHWVEFQSKFYNVGGDGYAFAPYSHRVVLAPKAD